MDWLLDGIYLISKEPILSIDYKINAHIPINKSIYQLLSIEIMLDN